MTETKKIPTHMKFIITGTAGMLGSFFVHPMVLVKTHMQMSSVGSKAKEYKNTLDALVKVIQNEGVLKCWNGLSASLLRQATYTTSRMGCYQVLVDLYKDRVQPVPNIPASISMGCLAGAVGAFVGNPSEVALVRMTTDFKLPKAERRNYKNVADALIRILQEEGIAGLWKGTSPTVIRAMVVNMCQLASYSQIKNNFRKGSLQMQEGIALHAAASTISGFLTAITSSPLDIAKTRIQCMKIEPGIKPIYSGTMDVLLKILKNEGLLALWKGFTPYFFRLTPQTILTFIFVEQCNSWYFKYVMGIEGSSSF